jgi:hypothetical protein
MAVLAVPARWLEAADALPDCSFAGGAVSAAIGDKAHAACEHCGNTLLHLLSVDVESSGDAKLVVVVLACVGRRCESSSWSAHLVREPQASQSREQDDEGREHRNNVIARDADGARDHIHAATELAFPSQLSFASNDAFGEDTPKDADGCDGFASEIDALSLQSLGDRLVDAVHSEHVSGRASSSRKRKQKKRRNQDATESSGISVSSLAGTTHLPPFQLELIREPAQHKAEAADTAADVPNEAQLSDALNAQALAAEGNGVAPCDDAYAYETSWESEQYERSSESYKFAKAISKRPDQVARILHGDKSNAIGGSRVTDLLQQKCSRCNSRFIPLLQVVSPLFSAFMEAYEPVEHECTNQQTDGTGGVSRSWLPLDDLMNEDVSCATIVQCECGKQRAVEGKEEQLRVLLQRESEEVSC